MVICTCPYIQVEGLCYTLYQQALDTDSHKATPILFLGIIPSTLSYLYCGNWICVVAVILFFVKHINIPNYFEQESITYFEITVMLQEILLDHNVIPHLNFFDMKNQNKFVLFP